LNLCRALGLAVLAGASLPLAAEVIWQEDFESARSLLEWNQTIKGKPTTKAFLRTDSVVRTGRASGTLRALYGEDVFIERALPENRGGVLTVWVYDPGYSYSGINADVVVTDERGRKSSLLLACGHLEFCWRNALLRKGFLHRREPLRWNRFQFVLDQARGGEVRCYVNGRLAGASNWRGSSAFGTLRLGAHLLRGPIFYDSIALDSDPGAVEVFSGVDMLLSVPRVGAVVYDDDPSIPATLQLLNYSGADKELRVSGTVVDGAGAILAEAPARTLTVPAGKRETETEMAFPTPGRKGRLYLEAVAEENGAVVGRGRSPVAVTFNPAAISKYDGPFGIQGIGSFRRRLMKNIGARCYNLWLSWPNSEREEGKIDWDKRLEKVFLEGVDDPTAFINMTFREIPKWRQAGEGWNHCVPKNDKDLEEFARKAAAHYRAAHNVNHWSYWEEPAGYLPWPRYLELMKAAVTGFRAGNAEVRIVGLNAVSTDFAFVEWMFKHGAGEYMEIFGHHFYTNGRPEDYKLVEKLNMVKGFMRKYNGGKVLPMWDTECGMYAGGLGCGLAPLTPEQVRQYKTKGWYRDYYYADSDVANFTVRKMVLGYANGLTKFFFHKSLRSFDYAYTLTALAVSALAHELSGASFVKTLDFGAKSTHGCVFTRDGAHFAVLWTARDATDATLSLQEQRVTVMDRFGNTAERATGPHGLIHLRLSEAPIYLLGVSPGIKVQPKLLSLECPAEVEHESFEVKIRAAGDGAGALAGWLSLELPEGWRAAPGKIRYDSGATKDAVFTVNVPPDLLKGDAIVVADLADDAGRSLYRTQGEVTLAIAATCRYAAKGIVVDGALGDWPADFTASGVNRLDQVVLGRPAVEDTQTLSYQVSKGSRFWQGPEDLSGALRAAWDESRLYVGIEVRDKTLLNDYMRNPYLGDSIEMFLDTRKADGGQGTAVYGDGVHHLRFVPPVNDMRQGRQVGYFTKTQDAALNRRPEFIIRSGETVYSDGEGHLRNREIPASAAGVRFAYKLTQDGYSAEFAIPFAAFLSGRPEVGQTFGFDVMLNDQDYPKEARAVTLCWHGDGKNSTNPSVLPRRFFGYHRGRTTSLILLRSAISPKPSARRKKKGFGSPAPLSKEGRS